MHRGEDGSRWVGGRMWCMVVAGKRSMRLQTARVHMRNDRRKDLVTEVRMDHQGHPW